MGVLGRYMNVGGIRQQNVEENYIMTSFIMFTLHRILLGY
jgi:hypothetical protein